MSRLLEDAAWHEYPDLLPIEGVQLAGIEAGVKYADRKDLALFQFSKDSRVSALFTQNAFCAAPVLCAKAHLKKAQARYLIVNTGNANAGTGQVGLDDALEMSRTVAEHADVPTEAVLPFSTGVIGERLPVEPIVNAIPRAFESLAQDQWAEVAQAILTTDTRPKGCSIQFDYEGKTVTITGVSKGAGMIRPNMATMLAYIATDLAVEREVLEALHRDLNQQSFNQISVDGDMSTNDACVLIATGAVDLPTVSSIDTELGRKFQAALKQVMQYLAKAIVRDGEGATKFVSVNVRNAQSRGEARLVATAVGQSPLVKTALFAEDPNWGRILAAVGSVDLDPVLVVEEVDISLGACRLVLNGGLDPDYKEEQAAAIMQQKEIDIIIDLARGDQDATLWTCDLSYDYVRINSDYRS